MNMRGAGKTMDHCIVILLVGILIPVCASVIGILHPADTPAMHGYKEATKSLGGYCASYGAFYVRDADGKTFEVCAACRLCEDSCAELYIPESTQGAVRFNINSRGPESLTIDGARWFVCNAGTRMQDWLAGVPVRAVYVQSGTLQTLGADASTARLIWTET
jgi:hypothetical protein